MPLPVVSEQDFEQVVLRSEVPALVGFFSELAQACKIAAPEVEAVALELGDKAKVVKVDVDRSKRLATMLRVQAVPTFMVFFQGRPVAAEQGMLKRRQLREMLEPFLPRAEGAVKAPELFALLRQGQVVAVDTRDAPSFGRAHIPGAANFPLEEITTRLAELHMLPGTPIVYCRTGDKAKELADSLAQQGVPVGFLEGGFLGWEAEGLPVERPD
jgi:thioredoxin 1